MLKKIHLILLTLLPINLFAWEIDIKANIPSWDYSFAIEVNLIPSKEGKIFYYTDWVWMINNQKEFKNPIIIKNDTSLNYWVMSDNFESSIIKENIYTFSYPTNIEIKYEDKKIKIKNNEPETINIWFWIIETNNLNYKVNKNTFINPWEYFTLKYQEENDFNITLLSPDKKVSLSKDVTFENKKEPPQKQIETNINDIIKVDDTKKEVYTEKENDTPKQTQIEIKEENNDNKITQDINIDENENIKEDTKKDDIFSFTNHLQTSIIDSNNQNDTSEKSNQKSIDARVIIILFILFTIWITALNIINVIKHYKKQKNKL